MNVDTLLENFEILAEAPGGIDRLRELILKMAVSGKLVEQSQDDGDAGELIPKYVANQKLMTDDGVIGTQRFQRGSKSPQLPYHIPKNWRWHYLGDVGAIIGGGTPSSSVSSYWSDHDAVPWLTPADMRKLSSRYVMRGRRDITPKGLTESSAQLLPRGAVLFSSRAPIGHVAIAAQPLATNQGFKSCVPYIAEMNEYIYFFLLQIGPQVDANATGTTFKEVSGKQVAQILIPVPPLAEQRRIVAKVDELMALCDQLEEQQKQRDNLRTATRKSAIDAISTATTPEELEAAWKRINNNWEVIADTPESVESLRALVFDLAIRGVLVAPDANDRPASELLKQIKDKLGVDSKRSELQPPVVDLGIDLPKIPLHWVWTSIQEIGKVNPRNEAKDDSIAGFVPMASVSANYSTPHQFEPRKWGSIKKGYTHLADGDIAVAKITPCFENGKSCVLSELPNGVGAGTTELLVVRPIIVAPKYILIFLKSSLFYGNGIPRMTGTAGQKRLPTEFFKSCPLPLPPLAEQIRIVAKVNEFMALCDQLEAELKSRSEVAEKFARSVVNAA